MSTSGIEASLYSAGSDGSAGGDIYYFSVCEADLLMRMAIADLRGHGASVTAVSGALHDPLVDHMNSLDGSGVLTEMNQLAHQSGFQAITTAAVVSYYLADSSLYFCYAGHPPAYLLRADSRHWEALRGPGGGARSDLPLGVLPDTAYHQNQAPLTEGDRLFLYTDGVVESPNAQDEPFGVQGLLDVLDSEWNVTMQTTKQRLLDSLHEHAGGLLTHDDVTFLLIHPRSPDAPIQ